MKIMIIIDEDRCRFPLFIGKLFEKESIRRPTVDLQIYSCIVNVCLLIYYLLVLEEFDVLRPLLWYKKHQKLF